MVHSGALVSRGGLFMTLQKPIPFPSVLCGLAALGLIGLWSLGGLTAEPRTQPPDAKGKPAEARTNDSKDSTSTSEPTLPEDWVKALSWRCIGPANMAGRI